MNIKKSDLSDKIHDLYKLYREKEEIINLILDKLSVRVKETDVIKKDLHGDKYVGSKLELVEKESCSQKAMIELLEIASGATAVSFINMLTPKLKSKSNKLKSKSNKLN